MVRLAFGPSKRLHQSLKPPGGATGVIVMLTVTKWVDVITNRVGVPARVLMSLLFLASGVGKISAVAATQAYMQAFGVPGVLLWPAAAWEIIAGIFLLIGLAIRPLALQTASH
jgi:DoxX